MHYSSGRLTGEDYIAVVGRILGLLILLAAPVFFVVFILRAGPSPDPAEMIIQIKDVARYQEARQKLLWEPVRSQFPEKILIDPQLVRLDCSESRWLDCSGHTQLRMKLSEHEIQGLFWHFDKEKIEFIPTQRKANQEIDPPRFYTSDSSNWDFPEDYTIMLLKKGFLPEPRNGYDYRFGVAISKQRNEIVYWLEY